MIIKRTPQAASPLASWLSYLENLHSKTIDLGLERVSGRGASWRSETSAICVYRCGYEWQRHHLPYAGVDSDGGRVQSGRLQFASSGALYRARTCAGSGIAGIGPHRLFAEIESARGDISLTYFEYGTLSALWLFKQAQLDVVILEVGLGGRLDATNIVDADVAVVTSIALDHTDWLGPDRESIGREKAGIFRSEKPAIVGEPEMPSTIADVAQEKVHCYNVGALSGTIPSPIMTGRLAMLTARWKTCRCRLSRNRMPQRRWRHCVPAGWRSVKMPFATGLPAQFCRDVSRL